MNMNPEYKKELAGLRKKLAGIQREKLKRMPADTRAINKIERDRRSLVRVINHTADRDRARVESEAQALYRALNRQADAIQKRVSILEGRMAS